MAEDIINHADNTELDFKDLNAEFLKRPAVVSIRKPFFTNAEMEDVLTRLLLHFVPPKYDNKKYWYTSHINSTLRAVVRRTDYWSDGITFIGSDTKTHGREDILTTLYGSEKAKRIIERPKIIYTVKPNETFVVDTTRSGDPYEGYSMLTVSTDENIVSPASPANNMVNMFNLQSSNKNYRIVKNPQAAYDSLCIRYEVYVLTTSDHTELLSGNDDNGPVRFKERANAFYRESGIRYIKSVLLYSSSKDKKGKCELTYDEAVKAFGKDIANHIGDVYAQKWEMRVKPEFNEARVISVHSFVEKYGTSTEKYIEDIMGTLPVHSDDNKIAKKTWTSILLNFKNNRKNAEEARTRIIREFIPLLKKDISNYYYFRDTSVKLSSSADPGVSESFGEKHRDLCISEEVSKCDDVISALSRKGLFDDDYIFNDKKSIPLYVLDLGAKFFNIKKKEDAARKSSYETFNYVTTDIDPSKITDMGFRFIYYAVLLKKILEKIGSNNIIYTKFDNKGTNTTNPTGKYTRFVDDKLIQCPTIGDIRNCWKFIVDAENAVNDTIYDRLAGLDADSLEFEDFIEKMERILFSPLSGMFITSVSESTQSVTSPIWNSVATKDNLENYFSTDTKLNYNITDSITKGVYGSILSNAVLACANKDVESINVSRVISGMSSASITIKNDNEKYSFKLSDGAEENAGVCIEPMDQVTIFLPDMSGNLNKVFTGVVSKVKEENNNGFHSISISADCFMKYLKLNRTNVSPSVNRQESENNFLTPFVVPLKFYGSIEQFLPFIYAQSLSFMTCQPRTASLLPSNNKLFSISKEKLRVSTYVSVDGFTVKKDSGNIVYKEISNNEFKPTPIANFSMQEAVTSAAKFTYRVGRDTLRIAEEDMSAMSDEELSLLTADAPELSAYKSTTYVLQAIDRNLQKQQTIKKISVVELDNGTVNSSGKIVVGSFDRVKFNDPLFNYLWYKNVSRYPVEEKTIIENSLEELLNDYVYTGVIGQTVADTKKVSADDIEDITETKLLSPSDAIKYRAALQKYRDAYSRYKNANQKNKASAEKVKEKAEKEYNKIVEEVSAHELKPENGKNEYKGVVDLHSALRQGKRCTYLVYKQRNNGTLGKVGPNNTVIEDRELVAQIDGTSQPVYALQGQNLSIQFSMWKTNFELISELANKFNFICYSTNDGVIRFAPYNFDLMPLNTRYFTQEVDTSSMLNTRDMRTLENDPNPLILKRKFITKYNKVEDDANIVNWVRFSGDFLVGGNPGQMVQALVTNPVLIKKYGVRSAPNKNVLGIKDGNSLLLYGLSWLDRQNKRFRSATIAGLYDSRMDINLCYFMPYDSCIYYCESLDINYRPGDTCTYTMGATYGRKPLFSFELSADGSTVDTGDISNKLDAAFLEKNIVNPTVYAQYKRFFSKNTVKQVGYDVKSGSPLKNAIDNYNANSSMEASRFTYNALTRNSALCCYNGYLWDNVSGISFEELAYNYGYLLGSGWVKGIGSAVSLDSMDSNLINLMQIYESSAKDEKVLNAINSCYIYVPSLTNPNALPDEFRHKVYEFTDLNVPGIFDVETDKIVLDLGLSKKEEKKTKKNT